MLTPVLLAATGGQAGSCGPSGQQAWLCSTVYRLTGSSDAAKVADSLANPLRIVFVLLIAFVAVRVARRVIHRTGRHVRDRGRLDRLSLGASLAPPTETERRRRAQRIDTLSGVFSNIVSLTIWTITALVILGELGIELGPLLAGAGVITVVIGFGAQTVVRDYLAGLFMVLEDQYGVGDVIDIDGTSGTVEWISLRVTRMRDVEGVVWWVPNGTIAKVGNKSQQWSRALLDIAVAHNTDVDKATAVIKKTADEMWHDDAWKRKVLDEPEVWGIEDIGLGGIIVRLVVKTIPLEQWSVARELRARLKHAFDDAGIEMAVPQQQITYRTLGDAPPYVAGGPDGEADEQSRGGKKGKSRK